MLNALGNSYRASIPVLTQNENVICSPVPFNNTTQLLIFLCQKHMLLALRIIPQFRI